MEFKHIILEKEDAVCTLFFNRPERMNSMTIEFLNELIEAVQMVSKDTDVRALIVT